VIYEHGIQCGLLYVQYSLRPLVKIYLNLFLFIFAIANYTTVPEMWSVLLL